MKEMKFTTAMTSIEICKETVGRVPGSTHSGGASKKSNSKEEQYRAELEDNRRRRQEAEQEVIKMRAEIDVLKDEQRKTNELLSSFLERMGSAVD